MWPDPISDALQRTNGAVYRKCALQVNPSHYQETYRGANGREESEDEYVEKLIEKAEEYGISVLGITDHNHVGSVDMIAEAAAPHGITIFPGFESTSQEGVHVLCLFEPGTDQEILKRYLGGLGIHEPTPSPKLSTKSFSEICRFVHDNGGLAIAAHATNESGVLKTLSGQARARAWKCSELLAAQIPGAISDLPMKYRVILANQEPDYQRASAPAADQAIAVVNAKDVAEPGHLENPAASTMIKMTKPSIEALRQACLDPISRIRLHSDPEPPERSRVVAVTWEGGFFDGVRVHLNRNLNVLVGGKGTGKSTLIESLRYVLDLEPETEESKQNHDDIIKHVVQPGTKITLLVYSPTPSPRHYLIKRTVPNPPQVVDEDREIRDLTPGDVMGEIEIYGQHEIGELTRDPESLSLLLDRFVEELDVIEAKQREILSNLHENRSNIVKEIEAREKVQSKLANLPALEEELSRHREAGVEEKLDDKSKLIEEEAALESAEAELDRLEKLARDVRENGQGDLSALADEEISELPAEPLLKRARSRMEELNTRLERTWTEAREQIDVARKDVSEIEEEWQEDRAVPVNESYEGLLRELDKEAVDGDAFVELKTRVEKLRPKKKTVDEHKERIEEFVKRRRELTDQWEEARRKEFEARTNAGSYVNGQLKGSARVEVVYSGDRSPVVELLREEVGGRLAEAEAAIREKDQFSVPEFVKLCRAGSEKLKDEYDGMTPHQASSITEAGEELFMKLEELELPHTVRIELNVAADEQSPVWREMSRLSAGQKATAALLLLLLESDSPLVIDQPEDDLDNRFIAEGIVPSMRNEKQRRQFVFATHNANLPVLGDAELILGLTAEGEAGVGKAGIPDDHMGSIDLKEIQLLVEEILEGGREAFEVRRKKYGF